MAASMHYFFVGADLNLFSPMGCLHLEEITMRARSSECRNVLLPPIQPLCTGHLTYFLTYQVSLAQDGVTEQEEHDYSTHRINHIILLWIACYDFPSILCSYFLSSQLQEKNIPCCKYYYRMVFCSKMLILTRKRLVVLENSSGAYILTRHSISFQDLSLGNLDIISKSNCYESVRFAFESESLFSLA